MFPGDPRPHREHRDPQLRATEDGSRHQPRLRVLVDGISPGNSITCGRCGMTGPKLPSGSRSSSVHTVLCTFLWRSADEPPPSRLRAHARARGSARSSARGSDRRLAVLAQLYAARSGRGAQSCRRRSGGQCTAAVSGAGQPVIAVGGLCATSSTQRPVALNFEGGIQGNTHSDPRRARHERWTAPSP